MITKENIGNETFESMTINDTPALFTDMRIDRNAVPEGLYAYVPEPRTERNIILVFSRLRRITASVIRLEQRWHAAWRISAEG